MKKLLIIILTLQLITILLCSLLIVNKNDKYDRTIINDTVINRVRIDSVHFLINKQESIINIINNKERYEIKQAVNANDSDVIRLFKKLVAE